MRALIFVHSNTMFAVDGVRESAEPLKRFKLEGKYVAPGTEVALQPGDTGTLEPGIYVTRSEAVTDVQFRAVDSAQAAAYDIVIRGDDKDEWPSILTPDGSEENIRIRACAEKEGVTTDDQLKAFFGELGA